MLNEKGKGNKIVTQVVHIAYVSCALMSINLQVPDFVLSYVHKTLVVNFMLFVY